MKSCFVSGVGKNSVEKAGGGCERTSGVDVTKSVGNEIYLAGSDGEK